MACVACAAIVDSKGCQCRVICIPVKLCNSPMLVVFCTSRLCADAGGRGGCCQAFCLGGAPGTGAKRAVIDAGELRGSCHSGTPRARARGCPFRVFRFLPLFHHCVLLVLVPFSTRLDYSAFHCSGLGTLATPPHIQSVRYPHDPAQRHRHTLLHVAAVQGQSPTPSSYHGFWRSGHHVLRRPDIPVCARQST